MLKSRYGKVRLIDLWRTWRKKGRPQLQIQAPKSSNFADVKEAIAVAAYVEQMFTAEQQWIMNRLSWLLTSQSFLIAAYILLIVPKIVTDAVGLFLLFWIPIVGFVCCVTAGVALIAGESAGKSLADARARLSGYINEKIPAKLPLIGTSRGLRDKPWTLWMGALPHRVLPWLFAFLWLRLFFVPK